MRLLPYSILMDGADLSLSVALCDDTPNDLAILRDDIEGYFLQKGLKLELAAFDSPAELLEAGAFDLYLLDVVMPHMTGIALAEKLREKDRKAGIIFITASMEFAVSGYSVSASGYIVKPYDKAKLFAALDRALSQYIPDQRTITVMVDRIPIEIPVQQISYAEGRLHNTLIHLANGQDILIYQKLGCFMEKLESFGGFCQCHKSYLVNLDMVVELDGSFFIMRNGCRVPLSRSVLAQSKAAFYKNRITRS